MKKIFMMLAVVLTFSVLAANSSCKKQDDTEFDTEKLVTRYSRDDTSGTRDGFFTAIGYEEAKTDNTKIPNASIVSDNSAMISSVINDEFGIGYVSLASLPIEGLKALKFEGVEASEETVISGEYKLSRNFNYITTTSDNCTEKEWLLVRAFVLFTTSKEGLAIISSHDGILVNDYSKALTFNELLNLKGNEDLLTLCNTPCDASKRTEIKFDGSTSVEKIAKALTASFENLCPSFVAVHNHTGSGAAYKGTQGSEKSSTNSMHVGFLSRELSSNEKAAEGTSELLCKDGIVVVVNAKNTCIDNLTAKQLVTIYSKENTKWSDLLK